MENKTFTIKYKCNSGNLVINENTEFLGTYDYKTKLFKFYLRLGGLKMAFMTLEDEEGEESYTEEYCAFIKNYFRNMCLKGNKQIVQYKFFNNMTDLREYLFLRKKLKAHL